MSADMENEQYKNILVALDNSQHSTTALNIAAHTAVLMGMDLNGLYVEDSALLRLAELPCAREVRLPSAIDRQLDSATLAGELAIEAEKARKLFLARLQNMNLQGSFQVVRGKVSDEIVSAARQSALLCLGKAGRQLISSVRPGSTALALSESSPVPVMFIEHGASMPVAVMIFYDGSVTANNALYFAARWAQSESNNLTVIIPSDSPVRTLLIKQAAAEILRSVNVQARFSEIGDGDLSRLVNIVDKVRDPLAVVPAASRFLPPDTAAQLLSAANFPLLLFR